MFRSLPKSLVFVAMLAFLAVGLKPLDAATYRIGSGAPAGANSYANLQALYAAHPALNNDTLIFYDAVDTSWTSRAAFTVTGTLNLRSNVVGAERVISGNDVGGRIFQYTNATVTIGSEFVFENVDSSGSGTMSLHGSTTLNADGVTYRYNRSYSFGGAIDTYGGSAQWINARGANFLENTGSRGGGVELFLMRGGDFTNANFIDNIATSTPGGAIIALLSSSTPMEIILGATDGQTSTFSGNAYTGGGSILANSLYITDSGTVNINIVTEGDDSVLDLIDPIYLTPGSNYTANFTKTGTGTWKIDGNTQINTGDGQSTISIREGMLFMYTGAQINMTGANDSFTVARDAQVLISGDNTIMGTTVLFSPGSNLVFDFNYYSSGGSALETPMLNLSGETLDVRGTRIDVANVPFGEVPEGRYALIQGESELTVGDFDLWVGNVLVNEVSDRYGYRLNYDDPLQLALLVTDTQNRVLTWQNHTGNGRWDFGNANKNWDVPNYSEPTDSFIPGDAVVFSLDGNHVITLNTLMPFSKIDNEPGMRITGSGNWTFIGGGLGDMHNPGVFEAMCAFVHDGTGTVSLQTDIPSTYHGGTVISGGGELVVIRGNQLGSGDVSFASNLNNRLTFSGTTTLDQQLVVTAGAKGTLTAMPRTTLTIRDVGSPAVYVASGGTLALEGTVRFTGNQAALVVDGTVNANGTRFENNDDVAVKLGTGGTFNGTSLRFSGNVTDLSGAAFFQQAGNTDIQNSEFIANKAQSGGAVFVGAGSFTAGGTLFDQNEAEFGGALRMNGGTVDVRDSNFRDNTASQYGGAIYYESSAGSSLTLGATSGKTSSFSGNRNGLVANSIAFSGAANIRVITDGNGVLNMLDPMRGLEGSTNANITKSGTGTWRLDGNSMFSGNNTQFALSEGKLELYEDATISIVAGTFRIDGDGTLVAKGGNAVTARTINLAEQATIAFDLTGYDPENVPLLNLTATTTWTVNGWNQNIDVMSSNGFENEAVYNLMTVGANANLNADSMTLLYHGEAVAAMRTITGKLEDDGTTLKVVINNDPDTSNGITVWTNGSGDKLWNATSLNWDGQGTLAGTKQFLHGDAVIFNDTAFANPGAGNVTVNASGVTIATQGENPGMIVNNSLGNDYTFSGGAIGGAKAGLRKEGTGTVTFANENKFTEGTEILGGTVVAQTVTALGTGDINTGSAATKGTIEFNLSVSESGTFDQKIDGDGNLLKTGGGNLTLTNIDNAYNGGTAIRGGSLSVTVTQAIGTGDIDTGLGEENGAVIFDLDESDGEISQKIFGTGSVVKSGSKTLTLHGENSYTDGTTIKSGRLIATNIDSLGTGNVSNDGELEFALIDGAFRFDQRVDGSGDVIKTGNSSLTLGTANTFNGTTTVEEGLLTIADEMALQNSTLTLDGGTFGFETLDQATLGGLAGSGNLDLMNDKGRFVALTLGNNGQNAEYSGVLSGGEGASLTKIGAGTQTLSGKNTYDGGTIVEEGRLVAVGLHALGSGDIKTNGTLELRVGLNDEIKTLEREITGTGSVDKSGDGILEFIVGQAYTGETIVSGGTLKVGSFDILGDGSVNVRSGGTLLVDVAKDRELASNVSVAGTLTKTGDGILSITGTPSLTGTININGGGLIVNGTSQARTIMGSGTTLWGNGRIDNTVTLNAGASQYVGLPSATGQSSFTAHNFVYEGGSTVFIKVGQYGSDQIIAEDGFEFALNGGTVNVVFFSLDDFGEGQTSYFDVFTAKSGVFKGSENIQFSTDGGLAFIGSEVRSGEKQRTLGVDLLATGENAYVYLNENQRRVLGNAGSYEVLDRFFNTTKEYRGELLNELTPMLQTAMPYISQRAVTQYNLATFERLRFLRAPLVLDASQEADYRGSSHRLMHRHGQRNYIWFQNFGDFLRTQTDSHCSGIYSDGYGFSLGVDRGVDAHTVAGLGLGGYFAKARTTDSLQSGKANSFLLSAYGMRTTDDDWTLSVSGGFSFNRYSIDRNAPSFGTSLHSGHDGTAVYAAAELTRKFMLNKLEVSPYLDVNWICLWEDGATEQGAPSLALKIKSQNTSSFLVTPGVRFGRSFRMLEKNIMNPSVYLGWVQDWGAGRIRTTAAFPGEPNFTIRGASMRNNRAVVGLNLNMTLSNRADLFARFHSELAENYSDLSMHWGIRLGF